MKQILIYLSLLLLTVACQKQKPEPGGSGNGKAQLTFAVTLPDPVPVQTRAHDPNDVLSVDLLIFDENGNYLEFAKTEDVATSSDGRVKTVRAALSTSDSPRTILMIGNGRDRVDYSILTPGIPLVSVVSDMKTKSLNSGGDILPLVMYAEVVLPRITPNTSGISGQFMRAAACIQVNIAQASEDNGLNRFLVRAVTLDKAAAFGAVAVPNSGMTPSIPTLPAGLTYFDYHDGGTGGYWVEGRYGLSYSPLHIYAYERTNTESGYMSLILKGFWDGVGGFYKILLVNDAGSPIDIVRNHRYIVTIVKVDGPGYSSVREAVANAPSNALKVEITDATEKITHLVSNGQYELGVTNNKVTKWGPAHGNIELLAEVYTTAPAFNGGDYSFSVQSDTPWLVVDFRQNNSSSFSGWCEVTGMIHPSLFDDRPATVTVRCGDMEQRIRVDWKSSLTSAVVIEDWDSYVFPLVVDIGGPWDASIDFERATAPNKMVLSGSMDGSYPSVPVGWGSTFLESRMSQWAYLHMVKIGYAANCGSVIVRTGVDVRRIILTQ